MEDENDPVYSSGAEALIDLVMDETATKAKDLVAEAISGEALPPAPKDPGMSEPLSSTAIQTSVPDHIHAGADSRPRVISHETAFEDIAVLSGDPRNTGPAMSSAG